MRDRHPFVRHLRRASGAPFDLFAHRMRVGLTVAAFILIFSLLG
ncbi:hypothetical protein [Tropicimonas isoalkanivorans]|nr:hypothetical protein [Tropicimonas isoalkanivorans]